VIIIPSVPEFASTPKPVPDLLVPIPYFCDHESENL